MIPDEIPDAPGSVPGHNSGTMLEQARAGMAEALNDTVRDGGKTFAQRRAEFIASAGKQVVRDRHSAASAADTIKLAGEFADMVTAERKARSDPYREAHLALSGMEADFLQTLRDAMKALRAQIDAWTAEEDERISQQQREQDEEMRALRERANPPKPRETIDYAAPAPRTSAPAMRPAKRAQIRGDLGGKISARDVVQYEIEDISLIPDHIMQSRTVTEAILTVVRQTAKHMGVPAGIRTVTTTGNQIS